MLITFSNTGIPELDYALSQLRSKPAIRKVVVPCARAGLKPVAQHIKNNSPRTHPLSRLRPPVGSSRGPMSRYVGTRAVSAKAVTIGARTAYNTTKFERFVVTGRRSGKRFFYPATQEYGSQRANPPIPPKRQAKRAAEERAGQALTLFIEKFREVYPQVVDQIARRPGARTAL